MLPLRRLRHPSWTVLRPWPLQRASSSGPASTLPPTIASLLDPASPVDGLESKRPANVTVHGRVRSVRRMKNVSFAHITDGSTAVPLQAVLTKSQADGLTTGTSVQITGEWKKSAKGTKQTRELVADGIRILGGADPETYPLQKKYQSPDYLRSWPHLRPRLPHTALLLQLRSLLTSSLTRFFAAHEFVQCYPPLITSSDCEGAGEVFAVVANNPTDSTPFFKTKKYLTVSAQLHLEALAAALPRVWTLSPSFRAEKSDTNRHLSEFYMLEAEISFIDELGPLLDLIEDMIRHFVSDLANSRVGAELLASARHENVLATRWQGLLRPEKWTRMTYTDALELIHAAVREHKAKFEFELEWGSNLQIEHEKYLAATLGGPVFVTDYPSCLKPFYMLPSVPGDPSVQTVACFDLLLPSIGELIGGSLREHRYDALLLSMKSHKLVAEKNLDNDIGNAGLGWYTELRKWGSQPHGGFGMGVERLLCYISGVENVREISVFPRWAGRCDC